MSVSRWACTSSSHRVFPGCNAGGMPILPALILMSGGAGYPLRYNTHALASTSSSGQCRLRPYLRNDSYAP
jgi:hypothetical protein